MNQPKPGDVIAVWFSCGVASAVATKLTIERWGNTCAIRVLNNPIAEEDPDNRRFLKDVEQWLGIEIESVTNPKYPSCSAADVWSNRRFMSGIHGAPCTVALKREARQYWESKNHHDWLVMGFTLDERDRHERFVQTERDNLLPVLIDAGITKAECYWIVQDAGVDIPAAYRQGYPNANCIGCVKATSPTYWNLVRRKHPEVFAQRAQQSRELGSRLVRVGSDRIFLDELNPDAIGAPLRNLDFECGLFCEERQMPLFYGIGA